jgi:zinc protease
LTALTLEDAKNIAKSQFNADKMYFVVAGDAKTQLSRIKNLGYGNPILLDREGNKIK